MSTTHVSLERPDFWDEFASSRSPALFNRSIWARVLQEGFGYQPMYCWQEDGGTPLVGMAGAILALPFMRIFYSSVPYGGIFGTGGDVPKFMTDLVIAIKRRRIHQFRIVVTQPSESFDRLGFTKEESARHVVHFNGLDENQYLAALDQSVRRNVRKSQKEGVLVEEACGLSEVDIVYRLYEQTMARNHAAAKYPVGRFRAILDILAPQGLGAIFLARYDNRVIGAMTVVCSDDEVHMLQPSHDHDYRHLCPSEALMFAALTWTMKSGRSRFDLMGSDLRDTSLHRFKAKWNADQSRIITYSKSLAPIRSRCWDAVRWAVNTPAGASMARWWQRKKK